MESLKKPYSVEEVEAVSTEEIARNLARITRLDYALDQNKQTDARTTSDWGSEDGRIFYEMTTKIDDLEKRAECEHYDFSVLVALAYQKPFRRVTTGHKLVTQTRPPQPGYDHDLARDFQTIFEFDGYEKVGDLFTFSRNRRRAIPTVGAYAAGLFQAKDIEDEATRALFSRHKNIKNARQALEEAVPPRFVTQEMEYRDGRKKKLANFTFSVFNRITEDGQNWQPLEHWWHQLATDLNAIDDAATRL